MVTLLSVDIGKNNTGIAFFKDLLLTHFDKIELNNCDKFILEMNKLTNVDQVVIEKQMSCNVQASKIEAWFVLWFKLKNIPVTLFSASKKYSTCDKSVYNTQYKRKKWAVKLIENFLLAQTDKSVCKALHNKFKTIVKKDDIADAILIGILFLKKSTPKVTLDHM